MINIVILICALILGFIEKPNLFKRPLNFGKIVVVFLLIGSSIFSGIKEINSDIQLNKDRKRIDSLLALSSFQNGQISVLNANVDTFRHDTRIAETKLNDTVSAYGQNNKEEVKEMAYKMTTIFSQTAKQNIEAHHTFYKCDNFKIENVEVIESTIF